MRGATAKVLHLGERNAFLLTHLMRGATNSAILLSNVSIHFYSHTSCEVQRMENQELTLSRINFYSHTSCEVQHLFNTVSIASMYFYSHTSCEVQRFFYLQIFYNIYISTHTPHARCNKIRCKLCKTIIISTHTPHARCNKIQTKHWYIYADFYSHTSCEVQPNTSICNM